MKTYRIGTTSYIIPAEILPNALYLARKVEDIELVLFEVDDGQNNLPSWETITKLGYLAREKSLTYTVHLPLDLRLGSYGEEKHISLVKAQKVIERTRSLDPWAYVLHLDGSEVRQGASAEALRRWQVESVRALEIVASWAGGPERLAVENLESYPLDFLYPVIARIPVSRCVDVGHLWLDGHDPLPYLREALPRTKVIHLHGAEPGQRAHHSLAVTPREAVARVLGLLDAEAYAGVLTLEVFGEADFESSLAVVKALSG
jgi:sugar phosphate isomerase/epimerase